MNLKIVYDSEAMPGFESGWGFSSLIELENERILFDTGWDGNVLLSNLEKYEIRPEDIDRVVLSHAHWDHIGGITHIQSPGIKIYVPSSFSEHLKQELDSRFDLNVVEGAQKLRDRVYTTGELENKIKEQALALDVGEGLVVIAGCSHPGVSKILSSASQFGELYGIVGGLHDFEDYEVLEDLDLIAATHCTQNKEKIREIYPESFADFSAGSEIELGR